jgi:hypothetical protein
MQPSQNRLANEKSPYLLQHADNPVDWYPWSEEAFVKAKKEDKPIFLSIGYSTCHWCHVMAHESFEDPDIAKILNQHFVSIKVDREERPDVDNIYMSAVVSITGSGGWPLSVFLTHDRKPFFGGTYFPPEPRWGSPGFKDLLLSIQKTWETQRERILNSGQMITENLQRKESERRQKFDLTTQVLDHAYSELSYAFDAQWGGFGQQPKFPMGHNLSFLLRYWNRSRVEKVLGMVETTLSEMSKGGMRDHLGGGFHRYSTDREWIVPHFEKMLYDQAILARAFLEAFQTTGKEDYAKVVRDILDYVLRDMRFEKGGFYSAEDADSLDPDDINSHKKEGAFYLWRMKEVQELLGEEKAKIVSYYFNIEEQGNALNDPHNEFTGKNILYVRETVEQTAKKFSRLTEDVEDILRETKQKLLEIRNQRPRPHLDDKILVDWNGLMISSLAFAANVLDEPRYRDAAVHAADFILGNMQDKKGRLLHRYRDGAAGIPGTLDDYAFFVHGLIDLYQATANPHYLKEAIRLNQDMIRLFWDGREGGFFFTADDSERLIIRSKEIYDGAIPSGNSMAAFNLIRLARITLRTDLEQKAQELMQFLASEVTRSPSGHAQLLCALDFSLGPSQEIVLAADPDNPAARDMQRLVFSRFLPNMVFIARPSRDEQLTELLPMIPFLDKQNPIDDQPTAYVCENHVCKFPATSVEQLKRLF